MIRRHLIALICLSVSLNICPAATWILSAPTPSWPAAVGGDTVIVSNSIPYTNALTIGGSGTSGNPITILFLPGASFTSPCWPTTSARSKIAA